VPQPISSAGKDVLVKRATAPFKPLEQACASGLQELELHRATSLLLNDDGSLADAGSTDQLINLNLHEVATAKLAVDRQVEERAIAQALLLLKEEAHSPHLLWQERALSAELTANIPRGTVFLTGIVDGVSHASSPQANSGQRENEEEGQCMELSGPARPMNQRLLQGSRDPSLNV
jgi:hypothetical protein